MSYQNFVCYCVCISGGSSLLASTLIIHEQQLCLHSGRIHSIQIDVGYNSGLFLSSQAYLYFSHFCVKWPGFLVINIVALKRFQLICVKITKKKKKKKNTDIYLKNYSCMITELSWASSYTPHHWTINQSMLIFWSKLHFSVENVK